MSQTLNLKRVRRWVFFFFFFLVGGVENESFWEVGIRGIEKHKHGLMRSTLEMDRK